MLNYPLELSFKIATIGTRVRVTDAAGRQVAYLRKKKFRFKEDVRVYEDEGQKRQLFRMRADRVVDSSA
jgi:Ni,Fe-hydrogenase maturation factor